LEFKNEELYLQLGSEMLIVEDDLVVCFAGGDGTACWALKTIDRAILSFRTGTSITSSMKFLIERKQEPSDVKSVSHVDENGDSKIVENFDCQHEQENGRVLPKDLILAQEQYLAAIKKDDQICEEIYSSGRIKFCGIPLGTGNDLARCFGWGNTYCGNRSLRNRVGMITANNRLRTWLDRWRAEFQTQDGEIKEWQSNFMLNYFSIGYTADIAYEFHKAREENENLYKNILVNKLKYLQLGAEKALFNNPNISPHIEL